MWRPPADRKATEEAQKKLPRLFDIPHDVEKIDQAALALLLIGRHKHYSAWKGIGGTRDGSRKIRPMHRGRV
jgi:hypothetical protein